MKKAQVAYEFMMVFFVLSVGFTMWIAFSSSFQEDLQRTKNLENMEDFSLSIKHEIYLIAQMHEGFSRTIELPSKIAGQNYKILIDRVQNDETPYNFSTIYITNEDVGFFTHFDVPLMDGDLLKGNNVLTKKQGIIEIKNE